MGEAGLFANERVELLDGTIVTMSAQSSPHAGTVYRLQRVLVGALGEQFAVRSQLPLVLDDWSEPEPDVAVCTLDPRDYFDAHPHPAEVVLVCEVAISSLAYDRAEKAAAYARSAIPAYWIIDVDRRLIHVLTDPDRTARRYEREQTFGENDQVAVPNGRSVAVSTILPPR